MTYSFAIALIFLLVGFRTPTCADALSQLQIEIQTLRDSLQKYSEKEPYIIVDTVQNQLQIRQQSQTLIHAVCATGSGKILLHPNNTDRWQFETPKGLYRVLRKVTDPIWAKPVWAFVETGETTPVLPWEFRRLDLTTLGDFALELGDGYEIHGTLYPALLGRHITHGCIRLNDNDLSFAYHNVSVGSKVYVY